MKIKSSSLIAAMFLCTLAVMPLRAQTGATIKTETAAVSVATNEVAAGANGDEKKFAVAVAPPARPESDAAASAVRNQVEISRNMSETVTQIVAIIAGCSIPIAFVAIIGLYLFFRHRKNIMLHDTLRAMIDKGTPIPPELLYQPRISRACRPRNDFRTGLILVGVGAGLEICHRGVAGMIVLFMGFAFLLAALFDRRKSNREADREEDARTEEKIPGQPPKL